VLFDQLAELTGQRNAIDARIVDIVAEIDGDNLWGNTGCRSVAALVAWKTGTSSTNAATIAAVADRIGEFPRCAAGMREGRLSLDQIGVIATRAGAGSDAHYAELARHASVNQLRTAVKLEPRPVPSRPQPEPEITTGGDDQFMWWRIKLRHPEAATFEAALGSHRDALIAEWKRDHSVEGDHHDNRNRAGRSGLGRRRGRPPARAAHHRDHACRCERPDRGAASGSAAERRRPPIPDV
jgi:hypothetical protein